MALLEDEFGDVVRKARTGLGMSLEALARDAGVDARTIEAFESYRRSPRREESDRLARALSLDPGALWRLAAGEYVPAPLKVPDGTELVAFTFAGMNSKGYLLHLAEDDVTLLVDPGGSPGEILAALARKGWALSAILLTHGHADHVAGLDGVLASVPAPVYSHPREWRGWGSVGVEGDAELPIGRATVRALFCPGHTPAGLAYVVGGFAFTGDALFAGSLGGAYRGEGWYGRLLASGRRLLELPEETRLLPGHGPATTVREERENNPFLSGAR